jgi:hypothetical protein
MLKLIYSRYVAAGGALEFDAFQHPLTGLVAISMIDEKPVITRWDEALEALSITKPTDKELVEALNAGPEIEEARDTRIALLNANCAEEITGGYKSDALGENHTYPSDDTAQRNMMGSFIEALIPGLPDDWTTPFWCANEEGTWAYRPHTASQIIAAGRAGKAHVIACQTKLDTLTAQVNDAETVNEIASIAW